MKRVIAAALIAVSAPAAAVEAWNCKGETYITGQATESQRTITLERSSMLAKTGSSHGWVTGRVTQSDMQYVGTLVAGDGALMELVVDRYSGQTGLLRLESDKKMVEFIGVCVPAKPLF